MSNSLLKYINNKGLGSGIDEIQEFTASNLPNASTLPVGQMVSVDGTELVISDSVGLFNSLNWHVSTAIPFILQSSGSVGANGALTLTTGINDNTISGTQLCYDSCYMYFIAGALYSGSVAGWYYTEMSTATLGTVYDNKYVSGIPALPSTKTPIVSASIGAYTQSTSSIDSVVIQLGKCLFGRNGFATCTPAFIYPSSANGKSMQVMLNDTLVHNKTRTTSTISTPLIDIRSRGTVPKQITTTSDSATYSLGASNTTYASSIDTTENVRLTVRMSIAVATDYIILDSISINGVPQNNIASDSTVVLSNTPVTVPSNMYGMQYIFTRPTNDVTNQVARNWDDGQGGGAANIASVSHFCPTTAGVYSYTAFDLFFYDNSTKDIVFTLGWPA